MNEAQLEPTREDQCYELLKAYSNNLDSMDDEAIAQQWQLLRFFRTSAVTEK